jgi:hypothetical protein
MKFLPRMALVLFLSAWPLSYAAAQQLDCNPCNDHYGRVKIGTPAQRLIQLKNIGTKSLRIQAKSLTGAAFAFGNFPLPVNLAAGATTRLPIIFDPVVVGKNTGTVTLTSNAKNQQLVIAVQGVGVDGGGGGGGAQLTPSPASLNFGNVTVASSASLQLTLSASNGSVTVSSAQANSSEFDLPGLTLPLTINSGGQQAITVRFTPNASGTASANLTLVSNATNSPVTVPLTGVGVAAGSHSTDLSWDASKDPVIGYNVYRGGTHGGPYSEINSVLDASTDYVDNSVSAGSIYYYVVKAVDANNQESAPSNEVKVKIPSP